MKFRPTRVAMALAATLGAATLPVAHAAPLSITTTTVAFTGSASVTDEEGGNATSNNGAALGSDVLLPRFDPAIGVLMGTTLNLTSTRTQTITVTAAGDSTDKSNSNKTASGSGTSTANIAAPGVDSTFAKIEATGSCTGTKQAGCTSTRSPAETITSAALAVASDSLNGYVGSGNVSVTRTAPTLTATQGEGQFPGAESTKYSVTWDGKLSLTFDYLEHAMPSLTGGGLSLDLDFGDVFLNDTVSPLAFSIFNAPGSRVGLDLDGVEGSGDLSRLYATLSGFLALEAGSSQGFQAFLDTSAIGDFSTTYKLRLSDADVGAASSRSDFMLTVNLFGNVVARQDPPPNGVPEPAILALVGLGLAGVGWSRRRLRTPASPG